MASDGPSSKRQRVHQPPGLTRGSVARITLHNFMSYTDAEIVAGGNQLNCIIGPNGTGKSSIVCAMCVGMGGPLKVTERGDAIGACVHGQGKTRGANGDLIEAGFVETELIDGNGPGKNLVVRLDFNIQNKEIWKMDGSPTTKTKVRAKMESLNIQVDNPLQFLPQDKVGQFSNMSPTDLLKHTEMAIGPDVYKKHEHLIAMGAEVTEINERLSVANKKLEDKERENAALQADVERFLKYQANLKKLEQMQGKQLWLEYNDCKAQYDEANAAFTQSKQEAKEAANELKTAKEKLQPLEQLREEMRKVEGKAKESCIKMDRRMMAINGELQNEAETAESEHEKLEAVNGDLHKLRAKLKKAEMELDQVTDGAETSRRELVAKYGEDHAREDKKLMDGMQELKAKLHKNDDAQHSFKQIEYDLKSRVEQAQHELAELDNVTQLKMRLVGQRHFDASQLAKWAYQDKGMTDNHLIGPLIMHIDILNPEHQRLAEEALSDKHIFKSFIAAGEEIHSTVHGAIKQHGWKGISVYSNSSREFTPRPRVPSTELKRFGISGYLDEALTIQPHLQATVLSVLRDICGVDNYLLGSEQTAAQIEQLQQHLASKGFENVTVLTPSRTFRSTRSNYGLKQLVTSARMPRPCRGNFNNVVDQARRKQLNGIAKKALGDFEQHAQSGGQLEAEAEALQSEVRQRNDEHKAFRGLLQRMKYIQGQEQTRRGHVEKARREVEGFDEEGRKGACRERLKASLYRSLEKSKELSTVFLEVAKLKAAEARATLSQKTAGLQYDEAKHKLQDFEEQVQAKQDLYNRARSRAKLLADSASSKSRQAEKKAPAFKEPRSEEWEAVWCSLPQDSQELAGDIQNLEEETSDGDNDKEGIAMKDYQRRLAEIDELKKRVQEAQAQKDEKADEVSSLEAEWKPALHQMVQTVDRNFALYFQKFRCVGEVSLSDGRKLDAMTGQPYGEDNYKDYKIHIKVKWRANEELHVLGEGGRDSGGERSVATMVYLISLQNINPAPFRVVDEINQAMDTTNERNVFECITAACREGGKQYFLLTPKLLPDLDYGEDVCIQYVFNGPWMKQRGDFSLESFC